MHMHKQWHMHRPEHRRWQCDWNYRHRQRCTSTSIE